MDPNMATYVRNNSIGIFLISLAIGTMAFVYPTPDWRLSWIPLVLSFFGTMVILTRYKHWQ